MWGFYFKDECLQWVGSAKLQSLLYGSFTEMSWVRIGMCVKKTQQNCWAF
jgi:hypothetical protein